MFNPELIEIKKTRAAIHLIQTSPLTPQNRALFEPGFTLQEHSIFQVSEANIHLKGLLTDEGMTSRAFTVDEQRWIINEQTLCSISFLYWATRYAFIIDWHNHLVRFEPNTAQKIILNVLAEMEGAGQAMLLQVLKARQAGLTTLAELVLLWRAEFHPWSNVLVGSSTPAKSLAMVSKMFTCLENQPYWLAPQITSTVKGEKISFENQKSYIHIGHGSMQSGLGRGDTMSAFHLSELIEFADADEAVDSSLLRAAHDNPTLIGFLESTAKGKMGWWYEKWKTSTELWPEGQSRFRPIFIPWYMIRDLYPTRTWLKSHQPPGGLDAWEPDDLVLAHAKRAAEYVQSGENPIATRELGKHWTMPKEQMWYWFVERQQYARAGKLFKWYQEMPADADEAFQNANPSIFDAELIYDIRERAPRPIGVYGILAPASEIPKKLQPPERDIDRARAPIEIHAQWGTHRHNYTLVPLLHRGGEFSPFGKLLLYEPPRAHETYGIGVDCGYGVGKDNTAIEVLRKGSMDRRAAQVAEWVSPDVNSFAAWPFVHAFGHLFSVPRGGKVRQPKLVIEGQGNGENIYNELKKRGWTEWHNWVRLDRKRSPESSANRQVWYTTSYSRPLLMDMFMDAIDKGWLQVSSPWFIDEMSDLEVNPLKMKIAAAQGKHDDRIMALGMVLYSLHSRETKYQDQWTSRTNASEPAAHSYPAYSPGSQGNDRSERTGDPTTSYTYKVIRSSDPLRDELAASGAKPGVS